MLQNQIDIAFKLSLNYMRYLVDFSNTKIQNNLVQRKTSLLIYWPIGYFSKEQISSIYWKEWDTIELGKNGSDGEKKIEKK